MKKSTSIGLRLAALSIAFAVPSFAADTTWQTVGQIKIFNSYVAVVLDSGSNGCGGSQLIIPIEDSEKIRLTEAAWLAGKEVMMTYTCDGTSADVSAVRAR